MTQGSPIPCAVLAGLVAAVLCVGGCARPDPPSVLLIVIDSLRRDHVGAYGYDRPTTPAIDEFARSSTVYANASSPAPWTTPAVAGLLTSALPSELGIHRGNRRLPDDLGLLSEALRAEGYATGAVVSHDYIGAKWNFDRGFDRFEEEIVPASASNAPDVTDAAIEMLVSDQPFFVFAHYFDVHFPYFEHSGFEMEGGEDYEGVVQSGLPWVYAKALTKHYDDDDRRELIRFYDSEIAHTDAEVGRLLEALDARGLSDRTLVIITSDHGEAFLERGRLGHTLTLFDELIAIPLIIRYPATRDRVMPAGRDDRLASLLDLYPTVLDVVGVLPSRDLQGVSLLAAEPGANRIVRSETSRGANLRGAVSGRYKLVRDLASGEDTLFDRHADPEEHANLAEQPEHAAVFERLSETIERWPGAKGRPTRRVELDDGQRSRLRALGYVDD